MLNKVISTVALSLTIAVAPNSFAKEVFNYGTFALGTLINVQTKNDTKEEADYCYKEALDEVNRLEDILSAYIDSSDVSKINKGRGTWVKINPETAQLLKLSLTMAADTAGAFDPTIGALVKDWSVDQPEHRIPKADEIHADIAKVDWKKIEVKEENGEYFAKIGDDQTITLGGIAKGYILDKVAELTTKKGCKDVLLSFGGDITGTGTNGKDKPWMIGIQYPGAKTGQYFATLPLDNESVQTSGDYERFFIQDGVKYHHIISPVTGKPVPATLSSVTIIGSTSAPADALCTALFVMGWDGAQEYLKKHPHVRAVLVNGDKKRVAATEAIKDILTVVVPTLEVQTIIPEKQETVK
ncbi:MAG: FAD:protein FMN transferase [Burkholderiales bacterium]|nr:FAD:protein FMN transferase [Burkholderiales bacterium]